MKFKFRFANSLPNKVISNNFYNFLGFAIPSILMFVFTPALIYGLGVDDYGIWSVSISSLGLMGVFELGLGVTLAKYVAEYIALDDQESLSSTVTMGILMNLFISIIIMLPLYVFAPFIGDILFDSPSSSDKIASVMRLISFGFIPMMLRNTGLAIPEGMQKYGVVNFIKILQNSLIMLIAFMIISLGGGVQEVVFGMVILIWLFAFASMGIAINYLWPYNIQIMFSKDAMKNILSFMSAASVTGIGIKIFSSLDKLVVGAVLGLSGVTYYSVAIGIANKLVALSSSISRALMPAASEWQAKGDHLKLRNILSYSTLFIVLVNTILVLGLVLSADVFLAWWLNPELAKEIVTPFRILVLIYGVSGVTAPAFHIANGIGVPWINAMGTLIQGIGVIILIVVLGSAFGIAGAAWANAISWVKFGIVIFLYRILSKPRLDHQIKFFNT